MTFSHDKPLYLSCATTPLGMGFSLAFHKLTSNNYTFSTKPWVRAFLLRTNLTFFFAKISFGMEM